ncbi:DUF3108 domain-containing protein [Oxalobacteraceae bacterium A2-2]
MTPASFLYRHRRALVLCAATALLHVVAIDWAGSRLGPQAQPAPPAIVTAQLRLALPQRTASAEAAPEIAPLAPRPPRPARPRPPAMPPPQPVPDAVPPLADSAPAAAAAPLDPAVAALPDLAMPDAPQSGTQQAGAPQAGAPRPGAQQVQTAAPPAPAADAAPAVASAPALPAMRRYKVKLPPPADFELQVDRVDADGTKWTGVASMAWHTDGSRYTVKVEAGISVIITRLNLLVLTSEGAIDDAGIAPVTATEKRKGRALTATHFNREQGTISFSASERSYPLLVGAQDKATVPFQLAGIGQADVNQLGGDVDILVGEDKEANVFRFHLVGEEELDTRMGKLVTWHMTRPPKPGTYSSRLDIWLAPGQHWYPVQIRNTEASGALTTQTVSRITMKETGS